MNYLLLNRNKNQGTKIKLGCLCQRPGNGGPQTCLPAAHGVAPPAGPYGPSSPASTQDPRKADDTRPPQERPHQAGSRGAERSRQGKPREAFVRWAMTINTRRAPACSVLVSSLVLRRHAQAWSTEATSKGFHISATRPRPAGRQDGGHRGAQGGVTTRAFCRQRLLLSG